MTRRINHTTIVTQRVIICMAILGIMLGLVAMTGCGSSPTDPDNQGPLKLVDYRGEFFSMKIPEGGGIETYAPALR